MIEVEMKFAVDDVPALREKLKSIYGSPTVAYERDVYYDAPTCLRVREVFSDKPVEVSIVVKGPLLSETSKSREEVNLIVPSYKDAVNALHLLGYKQRITIAKRRETWGAVYDVKVLLDEVKGLGWFAEVETLSENLEEGEAKLAPFVKQLGLRNCIRTGYADMCLEKLQAYTQLHPRMYWDSEKGPTIWIS